MDNFDIYTVLDYLPHRYPFLMIDKVLHYQKGESLTAMKNVSINEPFFSGHFPHRPVMPGVLMLEAMAQASGILAIITAERKLDGTSLYYFVGIEKARFKQPVEPGDQLIIEVKLKRHARKVWKFDSEVKVDGKQVCIAEIMCAEKDIPI